MPLYGSPASSRTGTLSVGSISTITDNSLYNAWPIGARLANGNLLCVYTAGNGHHLDNSGKAVGKISSDSGATWGTEFTIYDDPSLWVTAMGVSQVSSGRIFVVMFRDNAGAGGTGETGICHSDDNGSTWSTWATVTSSFVQESFGAGPVIEPSGGTLLFTLEGTVSGTYLNRSSHTMKSTDNGATWGNEVTVRNYATDSRPYYESKLVVIDPSNLVCVHRCSAGTGTHYVSKSSDGGATWGAPASAFAGYGAPSTERFVSGTLISTTRRNSDAACIAYTSTDDGTTWGSATVLDSSMFEMEYACPILLVDGRMLIVYGSQPTSSTSNSDIKQVYLSEV